MVTQSSFIGSGLYSVNEVALYARLSVNLVNRWFFGGDKGEPCVTPSIIDLGKQHFVSFLEFVQTLAIREVRNTHRVSLKKIRQLLEIAEKEHGISYPFARKGVTFLWGEDLGLKLPDGSFVEASGPHRRNGLFKEVVMLYKEDLDYNSQGIASLYRAFEWKDSQIAMNPLVGFGEPIVTKCGYSARSLWQAATDEGSMDAAALAYGIDREEVEAACRYFDHLKGNDPA